MQFPNILRLLSGHMGVAAVVVGSCSAFLQLTMLLLIDFQATSFFSWSQVVNDLFVLSPIVLLILIFAAFKELNDPLKQSLRIGNYFLFVPSLLLDVMFVALFFFFSDLQWTFDTAVIVLLLAVFFTIVTASCYVEFASTGSLSSDLFLVLWKSLMYSVILVSISGFSLRWYRGSELVLLDSLDRCDVVYMNDRYILCERGCRDKPQQSCNNVSSVAAYQRDTPHKIMLPKRKTY